MKRTGRIVMLEMVFKILEGVFVLLLLLVLWKGMVPYFDVSSGRAAWDDYRNDLWIAGGAILGIVLLFIPLALVGRNLRYEKWAARKERTSQQRRRYREEKRAEIDARAEKNQQAPRSYGDQRAAVPVAATVPVMGEYPAYWPELRELVLERDGYRCGNCGSGDDLHVHHIVPLARGGTNELGNLRTLCFKCHQRLHPSMRD